MPLTPDEIRQRQFDTSRRGYDRESVERFRAEVADAVAELSATIDAFHSRLGQLGIDELPDLGEEFARVAGEVGVVLEDARLAATEMRRRAEEDAARWRAEAEAAAAEMRAEASGEAAEERSRLAAEVEAQRTALAAEGEAMRAAAQGQAEELRGSAWTAAAAMLEQARADAEALITEATQDALFVRAGAERDALRLGGTARQDVEVAMKEARAEAGRIVGQAEAEAARLVEESRSVRDELAEEVRALDQQRIELLVDVEAMQRTFDQMDIEMEARLDPKPVVDSPEPEWEPEPAVRVVPASRFVTPEPVDADELMEEVARLREQAQDAAYDEERVVPEVPVPAEDGQVDGPAQVEGGEGLGEPAGFGDVGEGGEDGEVGEPDPPGEAEGGAEPEEDMEPGEDREQDVPAPPGVVELAPPEPPGDAGSEETGAEVIELPRPDAEVIDLPVERPPASPPPSPLDDLFASLRSSGGDVPATEPPEQMIPTDAEPAPLPEEEPEPGPGEAEPAPEPAPRVDAAFAAELRARLLLPAENEALRTMKRAVVDLQNQALADIHDDPAGWAIDPAAIATLFAVPVTTLVEAAYAAGHVAAGELAGAGTPVPVDGTAPLAAVDPGAELAGQLTEAHRRATALEGGQKEISDAVSRVFRAWRMDESERRLHALAGASYHHGVLSGLAMLDVVSVTTVADARGCADCAGRAPHSWDPAGPAPAGWVVPPAHGGCVVSIVPV